MVVAVSWEHGAAPPLQGALEWRGVHQRVVGPKAEELPVLGWALQSGTGQRPSLVKRVIACV